MAWPTRTEHAQMSAAPPRTPNNVTGYRARPRPRTIHETNCVTRRPLPPPRGRVEDDSDADSRPLALWPALDARPCCARIRARRRARRPGGDAVRDDDTARARRNGAALQRAHLDAVGAR